MRRGVAVALVRYRLGPEPKHPAQAEDVAAAVAYLLKEADQYGYDPNGVYLAGHSAGAHLASLIALDERYLKSHGKDPGSLAGVIGISGLYHLSGRDDLSPDQRELIKEIFGRTEASINDASPVEHVKSGAPPFLLLSASQDFPGFNIDARKFSQILNNQGKQRNVPLVLTDRDHFTIVNLNGAYNPIRDLVLNFLRRKQLPDELQNLVHAKRAWLGSAPSTMPFWKYSQLIRDYPIDQRFVSAIVGHYGDLKHELLQWPLQKFHAMELFDFLDALPAEQAGQGDYLVLTNIRNESFVVDKSELAPYDPVVVVGIDDQQDLFYMSGFYRMEQEYSWKPGPKPPVMARPLGAFLYFLKPPPPTFRPQSWHFAFTLESFRRVKENPIASLDGFSQEITDTLTHRNGCIYCHSFRGTGSRSHHVLVSTGAPHGGYAMSLESYPPDVWKRFIFHQNAVANQMGAFPNPVAERVQRPLHDLVARSRDRSSAAR